MRLAIVSDIHGNLPALDAVLADIQTQSADRVVCLGDLVGYGPFPNEVIERVRIERIPTIMGNYDDGVGFDRDDCGCAYRESADRERGQQSLMWTRTRVTAENKAFLRELPARIVLEDGGRQLLLVHGSPRKMNEYLFEDRPYSSFQRLAQSCHADVIMFGHTHIPYIKDVDDVLFVNAGSVGKPKDGDPRACYVVVDLAAAQPVTFRRVAYDIDAVTAAIRASTLPAKFADDLESGGGTNVIHRQEVFPR